MPLENIGVVNVPQIITLALGFIHTITSDCLPDDTANTLFFRYSQYLRFLLKLKNAQMA